MPLDDAEENQAVKNATQLMYMMMAQKDGGLTGQERVVQSESGGVTMYLSKSREPSSRQEDEQEIGGSSAQEERGQEIGSVASPDWSKLEPLKYHSLPADNSTIRLLKVTRSNDRDAVIECDLTETSLNDDPDFAAMSYVWGPPIFNHEIICNGQKTAITASLHAALQRYREDMNWFKKQYIWADALCINQSDKNEVTSQVALMRRIYGQAKVVHIFLGDVHDSWACGWNLLRTLSFVQKGFQEDGAQQLHGSGLWDHCRENGIPETNDIAWAAYSYLYGLPWFSRLWIIQEIALSSKAVVTLGKFHFEWDDLVRSYYLSTKLRAVSRIQALETNQQGLLNMTKLLQLRAIAAGESVSTTYLYAMIQARDFIATDARDKIIGLHGVVNEKVFAGISPFRPDYTVSTETLYLRFAIHLVDLGMGQPLWNFAGLHRRGSITEIPSWVPDWTGQDRSRASRDIATIRPEEYRASDILAPEIRLVAPGPGVDPVVMAVKAFEFDEIVALSDWPGPDENPPATDEHFLQWHSHAITLLRQRVKSGSTDPSCNARYEDLEEAFVRTLLVNDLYTGRNAIARSSPILHVKDTMNAMLESIEAPKSAHLTATRENTLTANRTREIENAVPTMKMQVFTATSFRRFAITRDGYFGLIPHCSAIGDQVVIALGSPVPLIFRRVHPHMSYDQKRWLVGDAYIHGVMDGEITHQDGFAPQSYLLV